MGNLIVMYILCIDFQRTGVFQNLDWILQLKLQLLSQSELVA